MKIYIAHSRKGFDFEKQLYLPLEHALRSHKLVFPYRGEKEMDAKKVIAECDLVVAEVSFPSTGLGVELGWANMYQIPILAIHKKKANVSQAVTKIAKQLMSYTNSHDLVSKIEQEINKLER